MTTAVARRPRARRARKSPSGSRPRRRSKSRSRVSTVAPARRSPSLGIQVLLAGLAGSVVGAMILLAG